MIEMENRGVGQGLESWGYGKEVGVAMKVQHKGPRGDREAVSWLYPCQYPGFYIVL